MKRQQGNYNRTAQTEFKETQEAIYAQKSADIFNAQDIPESSLNDMSLLGNGNKEAVNSRMKAQIKKQLPGIEHSKLWSAELIYQIKYAQPNLLKQLDQLYMLQNPEIAKALYQNKLDSMTKDLLYENIMSIYRFRSGYPEIEALREIEFLRVLELEGQRIIESNPIIQDIYKKFRRKPSVKERLGIENYTDSAIHVVNRLLNRLGRKLERGGWMRVDGKSKRWYALTPAIKLPEDKDSDENLYSFIEKKWNKLVAESSELTELVR